MVDDVEFLGGLGVASVAADEDDRGVLQDHEGEQHQAEGVAGCVHAEVRALF